MVFELHKENGIPLYVQIESKIADLIRSGMLRPGDKLPATRELSRQLRVHRNTVVQAYQELEVKGWVRSEIGSGTYVHKYVPRELEQRDAGDVSRFSFDGLYSTYWSQSEDFGLTEIDHLVRSCEKPDDVIAFSSVVPDKQLFPLREFQNCVYHAIQRYGVDLLEMGCTRGFDPFLDYLPVFLMRRGMQVRSDEIVTVNGIQQGIDLVTRLFVNPGDTVVTEEMTYRGALRIFNAHGAEVIGVPLDRDGMDVDALQTILERKRVKMIYTIPTFQNPTGSVMPIERRKRLLDLAYRHRVPIVEDQFANELRLEGEDPLPLYALDSRGLVIALGSFSKILFHGIRLGWVVSASREFVAKLTYAKKVADWQNNYLIQGAILEFCEQGYFDKYLKRKIKTLRERSEVMAQAAQEYLPSEATFHRSMGGLFHWVELPPWMSALELLMETRKRGVLFTPRRFFTVRAERDNGMRLGFVSYASDQILQGMRVIGEQTYQTMVRTGPLGESRMAPVI